MAQYNGKQHFTIPRPIKFKDGVNIEQISANKKTECTILVYAPSQHMLGVCKT